MTKKRHGLSSFLYHTSFTLFILILGSLLIGSAWGLGEQAWRTDHQRRWNMFALIAAYIALGIVSVIHVWSRVMSVKRQLRTMPKPYIPTKSWDVPKKVAQSITTEYARTAVIAHISQATTASQEGWGEPGTKWEGVHFRTYILGTGDNMRHVLLPEEDRSDGSPLSLAPLITATEKLTPNRTGDSDSDSDENGPRPDPLRLFVASYCSIFERARYAQAEPCEADAAAVEKLLDLIHNLVAVKRARIDEEARIEREAKEAAEREVEAERVRQVEQQQREEAAREAERKAARQKVTRDKLEAQLRERDRERADRLARGDNGEYGDYRDYRDYRDYSQGHGHGAAAERAQAERARAEWDRFALESGYPRFAQSGFPASLGVRWEPDIGPSRGATLAVAGPGPSTQRRREAGRLVGRGRAATLSVPQGE